MESLKIQIPEGFEVQDFNKQTGEVTFREKPKPIKERIKTIDDVLEAKGLSQETFKEKYGSIPKHLQSQLLAELLTEVLNEGWEPDWKDEDQWKSSLCFKSSSTCKGIVENFIDLFKDYYL